MPGILNHPSGGWAFQPLAEHLASALWLEVVSESTGYDYVLWPGDGVSIASTASFVPMEGIACAADKRLQVEVFRQHSVRTPLTHLCQDREAVGAILVDTSRCWALKYPTSCGGGGHRLVASIDDVPSKWPRPFIVQEFIRLRRPEVYRLYAVDGELFGFNARRYPAGVACSPWVAHARGARYEHGEQPDADALREARKALYAAGLLDSFGAVDLLRTEEGEWLVLEVGTDGIVNHVDRDVAHPPLIDELDRRLAEAFWKRTGAEPPWGQHSWRRRVR